MRLRILGLKPSRLVEWAAVMRREHGQLTPGKVVKMVRYAVSASLGLAPVVRGKHYRRRMRTCYSCPIYDAQLRRCRPYDGHDLGCGCYVPYKARQPGPCWGKEKLPESSEIGWD